MERAWIYTLPAIRIDEMHWISMRKYFIEYTVDSAVLLLVPLVHIISAVRFQPRPDQCAHWSARGRRYSPPSLDGAVAAEYNPTGE